jgi:hypothetical protein
MSLNVEKCTVLTFTRKRNAVRNDYRLLNSTLTRSSETKYLGIHLSDSLNWSTHTDYVTKKATKALFFIRRRFRNSNAKVRNLLYLSLVRPILEYAAPAWDPLLINHKAALERVQKRSARFVRNDYRYHKSSSSMVQELNWPSLELRRKRARLKSMLLVYNNVGGWASLSHHLQPPLYFSRNDHASKIRCKPVKSNLGRNSFIYTGPVRKVKSFFFFYKIY